MFSFITDLIAATGALGVGLVMLLENVFPPIPSELVMPLAGYLAATGTLSAVAVLVCGTAGAVLGAWLWYELGRRVGEDRVRRWVARHGVWLTLDTASLDRALAWFQRHEGSAVFWGRMVPGVRTLISLPAGVARMPLPRFLAYTAAGSLVWNTALMAAGYLLEANYDAVAAVLDPVTTVILLALVAGYLWRVLRQWRARRA